MVGEELLKKLDEIGWFDEMPDSERKRFLKQMEYVDSEDNEFKLSKGRSITWDDYSCKWLETACFEPHGDSMTQACRNLPILRGVCSHLPM